jgi:hypothetical protein
MSFPYKERKNPQRFRRIEREEEKKKVCTFIFKGNWRQRGTKLSIPTPQK